MKSKKLKKIISAILLVTMFGTVTAVFSSCGSFFEDDNGIFGDLFAKDIYGTEAAEVLLARERLNAEVVGQKVGIFSTNATASASSSGGSIFNGLFAGNLGPSPIAKVFSRLAKVAPGATVTGNTVVWDDFEKTSDIKTSYTQFIDPIDDDAAKTAELIDTIKTKVGVTDKWVEVSLDGAKYMLIVDESAETIIERYDDASLRVSTRYTREDAKCVYEMYSFLSYDDGTTGKIRNKCIPGEYYEYTYQNSGGFIDYFIADKSTGYWIMNRFRIGTSEYDTYFEMSAVKDGIGFGTSVTPELNGDEFAHREGGMSVSMFLPNDDVDLFEIHTSENGYQVTMFLSNVESGIDYLSTSKGTVWEEEYGGSGMVYLYGNGGDMTDTVDIHLTNGKVIKASDQSNGTVTYNDARITYSPEYHYDAYVGRLTFNVEGSSEEEVFDNFYSYLEENGIKLRVTGQQVTDAFSLARQLNENFDVMSWYGHRFDRLSNLQTAEAMLNADYDRYRALYDQVKDNESITTLQKYVPGDDFGKMAITAIGESTYSNGIISIKGLSATSEATKLLENGKAYTLKVGLALRNADGGISSVNAVPLESDNQQTVEFSGDALELTQNADFTVPTALSQGNYVVVIYFATADEGIRVTEMFPVAFFSAEEGTLESEFMSITVSRSGDNLFIDYAAKLADTTVSDIVKSQYTYAEIERALIRGILTKGYTSRDAVVEAADGEALDRDGVYQPDTYRLKFIVNTSAGPVEAYMYCTFEAN